MNMITVTICNNLIHFVLTPIAQLSKCNTITSFVHALQIISSQSVKRVQESAISTIKSHKFVSKQHQQRSFLALWTSLFHNTNHNKLYFLHPAYTQQFHFYKNTIGITYSSKVIALSRGSHSKIFPGNTSKMSCSHGITSVAEYSISSRG